MQELCGQHDLAFGDATRADTNTDAIGSVARVHLARPLRAKDCATLLEAVEITVRDLRQCIVGNRARTVAATADRCLSCLSFPLNEEDDSDA